jgi:hypothetical protein
VRSPVAPAVPSGSRARAKWEPCSRRAAGNFKWAAASRAAPGQFACRRLASQADPSRPEPSLAMRLQRSQHTARAVSACAARLRTSIQPEVRQSDVRLQHPSLPFAVCSVARHAFGARLGRYRHDGSRHGGLKPATARRLRLRRARRFGGAGEGRELCCQGAPQFVVGVREIAEGLLAAAQTNKQTNKQPVRPPPGHHASASHDTAHATARRRMRAARRSGRTLRRGP